MPALTNKEILIIDDEQDVRTLAKKILEGDGAIVREASSVEEGLGLATKHTLQLIITDLAMPGKTGFDLLMARKTSPFCSSVPTMILTGTTDKSSVVKAISMGAIDYITKPLQATLLLQKVRKILHSEAIKCKKFEARDVPQVELTVAVDILEITEVGGRIDSPLKIADGLEVRLKSDLLDELGLEIPLIRARGKAVSLEAANRYSIHLNFIGVGYELAKQFRSKVGNQK